MPEILAGKETIAISHSGKQYVHQLIQAVLNAGDSVVFFTPIWFSNLPGLTWVSDSTRQRVHRQLHKKYFKFYGSITFATNPIIAVCRELYKRLPIKNRIEKSQFLLEKQHDLYTSKLLRRYMPKIVIGFEISSLNTFRLAKKKGLVTILDLAQVHYKTIDEIAQKFSDMHYIVRNPLYRKINERKQEEYQLADHILTLSSFAKESLVNNGIPEAKIHEVNLGFDISVFSSKLTYRRFGQLKLMICGTDMCRKGLIPLVSAVNKLRHKGLDLGLTVVGSVADIKGTLNHAEAVSNISIVPFATQRELVKLYKDADLFVFPSYLDSWAMTVIEAMACGTPVIVSENTGSKDAVKKGGGIIIPTGSKEILAETIEMYYNNRCLLAEHGMQARKVAEQYTWQNYYANINRILTYISK